MGLALSVIGRLARGSRLAYLAGSGRIDWHFRAPPGWYLFEYFGLAEVARNAWQSVVLSTPRIRQ